VGVRARTLRCGRDDRARSDLAAAGGGMRPAAGGFLALLPSSFRRETCGAAAGGRSARAGLPRPLAVPGHGCRAR